MSTKFSALILWAPLALLGLRCQRADSADSPGLSKDPAGFSEHSSPVSLAHFESAEQQVAAGRYIFASTQLDKGIVAFRIETGKMSVIYAVRANRAIDTLTHLRKILRRGEAVTNADLHKAILAAMASEPMPVSALPKPAPGIVVPVNGN